MPLQISLIKKIYIYIYMWLLYVTVHWITNRKAKLAEKEEKYENTMKNNQIEQSSIILLNNRLSRWIFELVQGEYTSAMFHENRTASNFKRVTNDRHFRSTNVGQSFQIGNRIVKRCFVFYFLLVKFCKWLSRFKCLLQQEGNWLQMMCHSYGSHIRIASFPTQLFFGII